MSFLSDANFTEAGRFHINGRSGTLTTSVCFSLIKLLQHTHRCHSSAGLNVTVILLAVGLHLSKGRHSHFIPRVFGGEYSRCYGFPNGNTAATTVRLPRFHTEAIFSSLRRPRWSHPGLNAPYPGRHKPFCLKDHFLNNNCNH